MAVFFSFYYKRDAWRVQHVTNMGALEGQPILNTQDWEEVRRKATKRSRVVPVSTPNGNTSQQVYASIKNNLTIWVSNGNKRS